MKGKILLSAWGIACSINLLAQQAMICGTDEMNKALLQHYPNGSLAVDELEKWTSYYAENQQLRSAGTVYIVPTVVHIIHNDGPENISDAQVLSAIDNLNLDFRKKNTDIGQLTAQFKSIAADCEIEFRLAKIDPNGNPTTGIERIKSTTTSKGTDESKLNPWPRNMYMNIWVVDYYGGGSGWTTLPSTVNSSSAAKIDGIIMRDEYMGRTGTSYASSRVITHEVGHWLNLMHTYGGSFGSCGDDQVSDTPPTPGNQSCSKSNARCTGGALENVENYMDYTFCMKNFTEGQKTRMRAAITSTIAERNKIWQQSNLIATGVATATEINKLKEENLHLNFYTNGSENYMMSLFVDESRFISISIFDMMGKEHIVLNKTLLESGSHTFVLSGNDRSQGMYIAKVLIGDEIYVRKILIE